MKNELTAILLPLTAWASAEQGTCKALVLSGGGSNGAWESGVLWGLLHYGDRFDYMYDVVAGVSIGSINASGIAVFDIGKEKEATEYIYSTWENIDSDSIYQEWAMGKVSGFYKQSIYDTTPGFETMQRIFSKFSGYKRALTLSTVDIETGAVINLTDENTPFELLYKAVVASASVPGFFPPTELHGMKLVDGMTAYNTNVQSAIDRCRDMVDDDENITIDVLICNSDEKVSEWDSTGNAWQNYWRVQDIRNRFHSSNATAGVMRAHPNITWRHIINQTKKASGIDALDFSPSVTGPLQEQGKLDAQKALRVMNDKIDLDEESDQEDAEEQGWDDTQRDWTTAFFRSLNSYSYSP